MEMKIFNLPTKEESAKFSSEFIFSPEPLGIHKPWVGPKTREQAKQMYEWCK